MRRCPTASLEPYSDPHILRWSILEWLWGTGIEHQPGPFGQVPQQHDDLHRTEQAYRPSLDTFAPGPPASSGYVASLLPDIQQSPEFVSHANAVARMRSDLSALRLHGDFFGIDSDRIRVAHAYH